MFSIVHVGAWVEYQSLVARFNPQYKKTTLLHRGAVMVGGWCLLLFFTNEELKIGGLTLTEIGFWMGLVFAVALPLIMFIESKRIFLGNLAYSLFGLLYISLSLGLLMDLRMKSADYYTWRVDAPLFMVLFLILSLWINDTMAYIVGSIIGKTPLSPISPKKTWEGTIGGAILCIIVMTLIGRNAGIDTIHAVFISAIAAVTGTIGDLFESKLKRMAGVKDSGNIMPGHGGFLDRFDSLLFAVVFVWLYISFVV